MGDAGQDFLVSRMSRATTCRTSDTRASVPVSNSCRAKPCGNEAIPILGRWHLLEDSREGSFTNGFDDKLFPDFRQAPGTHYLAEKSVCRTIQRFERATFLQVGDSAAAFLGCEDRQRTFPDNRYAFHPFRAHTFGTERPSEPPHLVRFTAAHLTDALVCKALCIGIHRPSYLSF